MNIGWNEMGCLHQPKFMGLNFEHTQKFLKHTQQSLTFFKFNFNFNFLEKIGQSQDELVLMSCGLESTPSIHSLEFTNSW